MSVMDLMLSRASHARLIDPGPDSQQLETMLKGLKDDLSATQVRGCHGRGWRRLLLIGL